MGSSGESGDSGKARDADQQQQRRQLGLSVVCSPPPPGDGEGHAVDVVLVHGLGGGSRSTWTAGSGSTFWPVELLAGFEPVGSGRGVRVLTFGYSDVFRKTGGGGTAAMVDAAARDLLFQMRFARGPDGEELGVGRVS